MILEYTTSNDPESPRKKSPTTHFERERGPFLVSITMEEVKQKRSMVIVMTHCFSKDKYRLKVDRQYIKKEEVLRERFDTSQQLCIHCIVNFDQSEINMSPVMIDFPLENDDGEAQEKKDKVFVSFSPIKLEKSTTEEVKHKIQRLNSEISQTQEDIGVLQQDNVLFSNNFSSFDSKLSEAERQSRVSMDEIKKQMESMQLSLKKMDSVSICLTKLSPHEDNRSNKDIVSLIDGERIKVRWKEDGEMTYFVPQMQLKEQVKFLAEMIAISNDGLDIKFGGKSLFNDKGQEQPSISCSFADKKVRCQGQSALYFPSLTSGSQIGILCKINQSKIAISLDEKVICQLPIPELLLSEPLFLMLGMAHSNDELSVRLQ